MLHSEMSLIPQELHMHTRQYGYNPFVTNKEILYLISELDPYYSITEIATRYAQWYQGFDDVHRLRNDIKREQLPKYFWIDVNSNSTIAADFLYAHGTSIEELATNTGLMFRKHGDLKDGKLYVNDSRMLSYAVNEFIHEDANPVNPVVITYDGEAYVYRHKKPIPRFQYKQPLNGEALAYLTSMEPKFSLQKEYTRLQNLYNLKRKPFILDPLFQELGDRIYELMLLDAEMLIFYTCDVPNIKEIPGVTISHTMDCITVNVENKLDTFLHLVAKLWDGISMDRLYIPYLYTTKYTTSFTTSIE